MAPVDAKTMPPREPSAEPPAVCTAIQANAKPIRLTGHPSDLIEGRDQAIGGILRAMERPLAIYESFIPDARDAGWTRLFFQKWHVPIPVVSIGNDDLARTEGTTSRREDLGVLILPSLTADQILNGNRGDHFPPEYRGGIGDAGAAWIDRFVRRGGTLIALKDATALPIQLFRLPVRNVLSNPPRRVTIPGSILRLDLDSGAETPLTDGKRRHAMGPFNQAGTAFYSVSVPLDRSRVAQIHPHVKWRPGTIAPDPLAEVEVESNAQSCA